MNWFASNIFKADWFAARWFTNVTTPVIPPFSAGGTGSGSAWYPRIYCVKMPGIFSGCVPGQSVPMVTDTLWVEDIFSSPSHPNAPPQRGPRRKVRSKRGRGLRSVNSEAPPERVRNLDSATTLRSLRPGRATECSCAKYPLRMQDRYGAFDVLAIYCNRRDESGRVVVRHLG
jgi:hypothetical protein